MKSIVSLFAATALTAEPSVKQAEGPLPKSFEEVYGSPYSQPVSQVATRIVPNELFAKFSEVRTPEHCVFPLKVVIVQDSTGSFSDDYEVMRNTQLKLLVEGLSEGHPGSSFGLVSFRDKPVGTLGESFDYCQRYDLPLTAGKGAYDALYSAYGELWSNGGKDPAENQFGAIIAAVQSSQVGWNVESDVATRLIVLSTDSWPHYDQDGLNTYGLAPNDGTLDSDEQAQCSGQYYPSPAQVRNAILQAGAYSAFLVFDGNYANGEVVKSWEWFNNYLGQNSTFLEPLANDSSNFFEVLSKVIKTIELEECVYTSTTPAPTTTTTVGTTVASTVGTTVASTVGTTVANTVGTTAPLTTSNTTASEEGECPCGNCPCPEVLIKLLHRPTKLHLDVSNE